MAIDTTPSTVATSALQAIPFSSLIGGPLEACVNAQAIAAKTSLDFINAGLTIDPVSGEKKAINVTFQYNNNGQLATLVVPLLVIMPIPYLAINTIDIDFLANISAASSSISETSSDTELGVDVTAEAALQIGPFSLKVSANANYSSKQHSKASQDSRYSVEYTMGVKVSGGQTDMPAGLAAILNILQGSITSVGPNDMLSTTPNNLDFDQVNSGTLQVNVKTNQGLVVPGSTVTLLVTPNSGTDDPFESVIPVVGNTVEQVRNNIRSGSRFGRVEKNYLRLNPGFNAKSVSAYHKGNLIAATGQRALQSLRGKGVAVAATGNDEISGVTDKNGNVIFRFTLKPGAFQGTEDLSGKILIRADIPVPGPAGETKLVPEEQELSYNIIPFGPSIQLQPSVSAVRFNGVSGNTATINIVALDGQMPADGLDIVTTVTLDNGGDLATVFDAITAAPAAAAGATAATATSTTAANGAIDFTYKLKADNTTGPVTGNISFIGDNVIQIDIPFTIDKKTV